MSVLQTFCAGQPPVTRWYLPSTGAAAVTPTNDAWYKTTGAGSSLIAVRIPIGSSMSTITNTTDATNYYSTLIRQYVTEPLVAQTIINNSDTLITGSMRCISNSPGSQNLAFSLRGCSNDGTTIRSGGRGISSYLPDTMTTSLTNRILMSAQGATNMQLGSGSIILQAGDRLIFEFGYKSGVSNTYNGGISFGDNSGTDCVWNESDTAANNPWVEISQYIGTQ